MTLTSGYKETDLIKRRVVMITYTHMQSTNIFGMGEGGGVEYLSLSS